MIQGFANQIMDFSSSQNRVNLRSNDVSRDNDFNKILDSKTSNKDLKNAKKFESNSDLIKKQNSLNNARKVEIKNEKPSEKETKKNDKQVDNELSKEEKTIEELIENLEDILLVFQNIIAINLNDLEDVDLEEVNLEISLEELEGLKLSLEGLVETLNLGEDQVQVNNTIAKIGQMIEDVKLEGEIDLPAEEFIVELKEVMDIVALNTDKTMGKGTSEQIKDSSEQLQQLVDLIEGVKEPKDSKVNTDIKDANKSGENTKLLNEKSLKTQARDLIDASLDETSDLGFKVKVVTEKKEGINLFESLKDMENFNTNLMNLDKVDSLDEINPEVEIKSDIEKIATNMFTPQTQNQISPEASSKIVNSNIINPEQYMNIDKTDVLKQITSKVRSDYDNELNEINIKLTPEHLGNLTIKVSLERGILSARALVENVNVKQLLQSNLGELKESLKEQGIEFNSIDVSVGEDQEFEEKSPNFFRNEKRIKGLKTNIENPIDTNYYEELNDDNSSSNLEVGEGSVDITV